MTICHLAWPGLYCPSSFCLQQMERINLFFPFFSCSQPYPLSFFLNSFYSKIHTLIGRENCWIDPPEVERNTQKTEYCRCCWYILPAKREERWQQQQRHIFPAPSPIAINKSRYQYGSGSCPLTSCQLLFVLCLWLDMVPLLMTRTILFQRHEQNTSRNRKNSMFLVSRCVFVSFIMSERK